MTYRPDLSFETDTEQLPPKAAKERIKEITNITAEQARALKGSRRFERYNEKASAQETTDPPIAGGPTDDLIHLRETPADEWGDDELAEADELVNYAKRTIPQYGPDEGEPLLPDESPDIHKGEFALATWGFDMEAGDGWPPGGER